MPKLKFIDDNQNEHELKLQNIPSKSLKKGDIVIASYEVGDASLIDSQKALEQLRNVLKKVLPKGIEVVAIATRHGKEDVKIKIVKNKTKRD